MLEGVKAISFDVDDTLWDFDSIMQSALSAVVEKLNLRGLNLDFRITVDSLDVTWQNLRDHRKGQITDLVQLRKDSITAALKQIGITDRLLTTELTDLYFRVRHENNLPFKDVLPALTVLKEHFTLGTLTNGNTRPASLGIDVFSISRCFQSSTEAWKNQTLVSSRLLLPRLGVSRTSCSMSGIILSTMYSAHSALVCGAPGLTAGLCILVLTSCQILKLRLFKNWPIFI